MDKHQTSMMKPNRTRRRFSRLLVLLLTTSSTVAHSNLRWPEPYNVDRYDYRNDFECKPSKNCWPCLRLPAAVHKLPVAHWRRGQRVEIQWQRNNHRDGFYRRSIVPFKHIMNEDAHNKLAFGWGCYSQNTIGCPGATWRNRWRKRCGADNHNPPLLHWNKMRVPAVYPDGLYVFAQTWFGGSDRRGDKDKGAYAKFSNFAMCALVRIQGGTATEEKEEKIFQHGKRDDFDLTGKENSLGPMQCWSTSDRVGQCGGNPCDGVKLQAMIPAAFKNNKGRVIQPKPLEHREVMTLIEQEPNYEMESVYDEEVPEEERNTSDDYSDYEMQEDDTDSDEYKESRSSKRDVSPSRDNTENEDGGRNWSDVCKKRFGDGANYEFCMNICETNPSSCKSLL